VLKIEFSNALREDRVICRFNDAWILKKIEKTPPRD
jgi:hypothetical protein